MKITPGKIKALFDREMGYLSKLNFVMIAFLFIKDVGFHWWYLLGIPLFLVWVWIDVKYIMPDEYNYIHRKSPVLNKILNNIK